MYPLIPWEDHEDSYKRWLEFQRHFEQHEKGMPHKQYMLEQYYLRWKVVDVTNRNYHHEDGMVDQLIEFFLNIDGRACLGQPSSLRFPAFSDRMDAFKFKLAFA